MWVPRILSSDSSLQTRAGYMLIYASALPNHRIARDYWSPNESEALHSKRIDRHIPEGASGNGGIESVHPTRVQLVVDCNG
jgi:hypothetical protein